MQQIFFQGAAVDADADGNPALGGELDYFLDAPTSADVSWIQTQAVHSLLQRYKGEFVVEVNVRHQGDADLSFDLAELFRCLANRDCNSHDVATSRLQGPNLVHCSTHIPGVRLGHGLDRDGGIATYGNLA